MMDIQELIERLKIHLQSYAAYNNPDLAHVLEDAADALEKLQAELEQAKREKDKLERFLGELEGAIYTGQYFHLRPMIEKWRGQKKD